MHVLALSHHFFIYEYLMPNFQVKFVRAVATLEKYVFKQVHLLEILVISYPFFFSKVPYNVQSRLPKLTKSSFGHDLVSSNNKIRLPHMRCAIARACLRTYLKGQRRAKKVHLVD